MREAVLLEECEDAEFVADVRCTWNDSYLPINDAFCEEWGVVTEGPDVGVEVEGVAAAGAEELRAQAAKLAPEMERHQVPVEYLANPALTKALQLAHNAKTPKAREVADSEIKERMFLIGKEGVNGPDIDQLRKETTANVNGAGDEHFKDPAFVDAAKDLHEARLLAEGGFKGDKWSTQEQRYERAEKELFARMEDVGREIENRVTGNDSSRLKDQGLKTETAAQAGYGSAEHHKKFAESLAGTGANETQIRGPTGSRPQRGHKPQRSSDDREGGQGQKILFRVLRRCGTRQGRPERVHCRTPEPSDCVLTGHVKLRVCIMRGKLRSTAI
ncbi:hypothetical protein [Paenarthrobacter sp. UW852]|uniref:hypothetical protein n=1 Tax=Paenarthrobacter sp. UW852 TaxID=2951989 RepID=UPI0027D2C73E|nr:hypothetical protein [Paenarthrobacter sp. UW852]